MFGLLFPLFMFFAFFVGRHLDLTTFFPAFLAMMLFFTASSVGPLITPWEKREKTYERLLSYPVTQDSIILGDVVAGAVFGIGISLLVWVASIFFVPVGVTSWGLFVLAFILGTLSCAALGALLASPASDSPPNVMIFSNLVRFPLIFISGIFVPLQQMEGWALTLAYCSPLTYLVDLFNAAMSGRSVFSPLFDCTVLFVVSVGFIIVARVIQKRNMMKGM
jgi:ABC-2 type transport system permease protein